MFYRFCWVSHEQSSCVHIVAAFFLSNLYLFFLNIDGLVFSMILTSVLILFLILRRFSDIFSFKNVVSYSIGLREFLLNSSCFPQHTNTYVHICAGISILYILCMELMNQKTQTFKMLLDIAKSPSKRLHQYKTPLIVYKNACFSIFHQPFPQERILIFLIIKTTSYIAVTMSKVLFYGFIYIHSFNPHHHPLR